MYGFGEFFPRFSRHLTYSIQGHTLCCCLIKLHLLLCPPLQLNEAGLTLSAEDLPALGKQVCRVGPLLAQARRNAALNYYGPDACSQPMETRHCAQDACYQPMETRHCARVSSCGLGSSRALNKNGCAPFLFLRKCPDSYTPTSLSPPPGTTPESLHPRIR